MASFATNKGDSWFRQRRLAQPAFHRSRIGKGFSLMEAVLILATAAQRYRLTLVLEHSIVPQPSITLGREHGIQVTLHKR